MTGELQEILHSVKELLNVGIQTDLLLCRTEREIPASERKKVALFCNVREDAVVQALDVDTILKNTSSFENRDTSLGSSIKYEKPFDSLHNLVKSSSSIYNKVTLNKCIVGKWLVEKRIGNGEEKLGDQKVFAVYEEDSSFFML